MLGIHRSVHGKNAFKVTHQELSSKVIVNEILCVVRGRRRRLVNRKILLLFPFLVSQKINLLNQMHCGTASMNNERTLEIIRDDLTSSVMEETEGTHWDNDHPHLFVVMGASVS